MSDPTRWPITHSCGHQATADLSCRPEKRRAGFAEWLAKRPCTDCWRAERTQDEADRRASETREAREWAGEARMPQLDGTERAVAWAETCRYRLLAATHTELVAEAGSMTEDEYEQLLGTARTITAATWWLDYRGTAPAQLPTVLDTVTDDERGCENPY